MKVDVYSYKDHETKIADRRYLDEAIENFAPKKSDPDLDREYEKARREIVKTGRYWLSSEIMLRRSP